MYLFSYLYNFGRKTKDSDDKSPLMAQQIKQKRPVVLNVACAAIN